MVGAAVALAGFAYLIFTQVSLSDDEFLVEAPERWNYAAIALTVIALGLLVVAAAQIVSALTTRGAPRSKP